MRARKITEKTDLSRVAPLGATLELVFHPLGDLVADDEGDPYDLLTCDIVARVNGRVLGWVKEHRRYGDTILISTRGDEGYPDGVLLEFDSCEIRSLRIVDRGLPLEATFGKLRLSWCPDDVDHGVTANGERVPAALVSTIAHHRGYTYTGDPTTGREQLRAWRNESELCIDSNGLRRGCAKCSLEQLDAALDWCAERLWGYEPEAGQGAGPTHTPDITVGEAIVELGRLGSLGDPVTYRGREMTAAEVEDEVNGPGTSARKVRLSYHAKGGRYVRGGTLAAMVADRRLR